MTQISPTEFGRMQSDVEHIKEDVIEIRDIVRSQDYVSRREYQKTAELLEKHDERLKGIEKQIGINDATFSGQLAKFLNKGIVMVFGSGLMLVVMYAVWSAQSAQITKLGNDVHTLGERVRSSKVRE